MRDARSPAGSGPRTWRGAPLRPHPHPHPHPALTHCTRVPESGQISLRRSAASQEGLRGAVPASPGASTDSALGGKRKHRAGEKAEGAPPPPAPANQRRDLAGCSTSAPPPRRARGVAAARSSCPLSPHPRVGKLGLRYAVQTADWRFCLQVWRTTTRNSLGDPALSSRIAEKAELGTDDYLPCF